MPLSTTISTGAVTCIVLSFPFTTYVVYVVYVVHVVHVVAQVVGTNRSRWFLSCWVSAYR